MLFEGASKRKRIIIFTADLPNKEGEDVHARYVILEVLMDMHWAF